MASLYEQMDDLLTPDSVKKGLAESAEKNKDMSMSDIFSFDRFKKEALPQFRDKEEIIEKATASGTGLLTGTLGLPSDIVSLASAGADVADKYIDNPTATVMKEFLNRAEQEVGRPAFDKKFTEITGLESNPENIDQLIGEIISPTGAFLVPLKTLNKLFTPIKKGMSEFFDNMPTGGGSLKSANNAPIQPIKKDESIDPNRPIINLSEIGIKTPDGATASKTYENLETDAMGGVYSEERYKNLSLDEKDRLYKETGVYRGQDGKLRYKIPTADFQLNEGYLKELGVIEGGFNSKNIPAEGITLEQMLNARDLYRNYATPAANGEYGLIKDIKIKNFDAYIQEKNLDPTEAMTDLAGTQAIYSRNKGTETIYVRGGLKSNVRDDLLHEIQHAIQHREGFNAGSSPNKFLTDTITEFGQRYKNTLQDVYTEKRNALSEFEQYTVGGKRVNIDFLKNKELLESVTDKLVKREYGTLLNQYNKTNADGYFDELPAGIRYLQRKDMLVDPPMVVRGESKPFVYQGYDTRNVKFNDNERNLANILSNNESFQNYVRDRILIEHKARNLKLMEAAAHKEYIKVPGEVEARKIVEDDVTYRNIVKQLQDAGRPIPTDPKERDELINRIFRSRFMKPSEKGVLQGQSVKVDSGGNTTSPIRAGEEQ